MVVKIINFEALLEQFVYINNLVYGAGGLNSKGFVEPDDLYCKSFGLLLVYKMKDIYKSDKTDKTIKYKIEQLYNKLMK